MIVEELEKKVRKEERCEAVRQPDEEGGRQEGKERREEGGKYLTTLSGSVGCDWTC